MSAISHTHGSNRRFSFRCEALGSATALEVVSFEGEEAMAGLYRFELLLVSPDNDIDERKLVGQQGVFRLNDGVAGGQDTCYSGVVESFEQMHQITGWTFYKAVLVPRLWRLGQYYLTEVYLDKTPLELLDLIMQGARLNHNEYDLRLANKDRFPKRKFIFQFQESYLDFLSRWCERLGIYWWFEYQNDIETIVFGNNIRSHDSQVLQLAYQRAGELDALVTGKRRVQSINLTVQSLPERITVMDHYYKRASQQIKGSALVDEQGIGEVTYYGLYINTNEAAQALARIRAEGLICRSRQFNGESTATGLRCGYLMELTGHHRAGFNQQYLLTKVSHHGSQSGMLLDGLGVPTADDKPCRDFYQASFCAIPADVQFRPEIIHPWPSIDGNLTAYIDAEGSGEYAELNEYGEYKVQLPYDVTEKNPDKASAWIRMATPYAGDGYGMHFPLHKGTEVLLSFHNGNPDDPVITGAVHNSINANVVTNENQTQSVIQTAGGNSLEFHDLDGKQGIHLFSPAGDTHISIGARPPQPQGVGAGSSNVSGTWTDDESGNKGGSGGTWTESVGSSGDIGIAITTDADVTQSVAGNATYTYGTTGNNNFYTATYNDSYTSTNNGSCNAIYNEGYTETITGTYNETVNGTYNEVIGGNCFEEINGNYSFVQNHIGGKGGTYCNMNYSGVDYNVLYDGGYFEECTGAKVCGATVTMNTTALALSAVLYSLNTSIVAAQNCQVVFKKMATNIEANNVTFNTATASIDSRIVGVFSGTKILI
jgi:type VI secretion system secreted protein VgrG